MNWKLLVSKNAKRELGRLPNRDQVRIEAVLDEMEADPFSGDIKRMQPPGWRRRLGNYRIFYDLDVGERLIVVTSVKRRTSTTY
jgi:mRNA-degrading endonuclease RelE of RelBE toxin-antitoxin system